jgi:hypothetical protein
MEKMRQVVHRLLVDYFPKYMIGREWKIQFGKKLDWNNPVTLNEKIQWLMANTDTSMWTRLADKVAARDFIREKGFGDTLTEVYGVWERAEDIDFDSLPEKCVLKCNHDCESIIMFDKSKGYDKQQIINHFKKHLVPFGYGSCEPHYTKIKPKVMAEELIPMDPTVDSTSLVDYKFWCFDGYVHNCTPCYDRKGLDMVCDINLLEPWRLYREGLTEEYRQSHTFKDMPAPPNLNRMIEMCHVLSTGFPEVRVDLYDTCGRIYFGEMTFSAGSGIMGQFSDEYQKQMGSYVKLPINK